MRQVCPTSSCPIGTRIENRLNEASQEIREAKRLTHPIRSLPASSSSACSLLRHQRHHRPLRRQEADQIRPGLRCTFFLPASFFYALCIRLSWGAVRWAFLLASATKERLNPSIRALHVIASCHRRLFRNASAQSGTICGESPISCPFSRPYFLLFPQGEFSRNI